MATETRTDAAALDRPGLEHIGRVLHFKYFRLTVTVLTGSWFGPGAQLSVWS